MTICIQLPLLYDFEHLEYGLFLHSEVISVKQFSKEEVFAAGGIPSIHIPCSCSDELKEYMMGRLGYTESMADYELLYQCPRWFLKGYSSEEAFELFEKDKLKKNLPK